MWGNKLLIHANIPQMLNRESKEVKMTLHRALFRYRDVKINHITRRTIKRGKQQTATESIRWCMSMYCTVITIDFHSHSNLNLVLTKLKYILLIHL